MTVKYLFICILICFGLLVLSIVYKPTDLYDFSPSGSSQVRLKDIPESTTDTISISYYYNVLEDSLGTIELILCYPNHNDIISIKYGESKKIEPEKFHKILMDCWALYFQTSISLSSFLTEHNKEIVMKSIDTAFNLCD